MGKGKMHRRWNNFSRNIKNVEKSIDIESQTCYYMKVPCSKQKNKLFYRELVIENMQMK